MFCLTGSYPWLACVMQWHQSSLSCIPRASWGLSNSGDVKQFCCSLVSNGATWIYVSSSAKSGRFKGACWACCCHHDPPPPASGWPPNHPQPSLLPTLLYPLPVNLPVWQMTLGPLVLMRILWAFMLVPALQSCCCTSSPWEARTDHDLLKNLSVYVCMYSTCVL